MFPLNYADPFITPNPHPTQYENILFSIKYRYANNTFYAILAWCWGLGLGRLVQFIGFKAIALFGCFVLLNLEKLLQYFV